MNEAGHAELALARREFLKACGVLAATLAGCGTLGANTRLAATLVDQPHPDAWLPVLQGLCSALLPLEDPRFPLSPGTVEARLRAMFPVDAAADLLPLRRGLVLFDDTQLFAEKLAILNDDEREQLQARGMLDAQLDAAIAHKHASDAAAYAAVQQAVSSARFSQLPLSARRSYLRLWSGSAFTLRRRFYRSAKVLTMLSAYSLEPSWQVIGYEGPLLGRS